MLFGIYIIKLRAYLKDALWLPWSRWMYLEIRSGQGNCVVEFFLLREFESLIIYQLFSDDYNPNTYTFFRYPLLPRKSLYLFSPLMYGIFTPALQHFLFFFFRSIQSRVTPWDIIITRFFWQRFWHGRGYCVAQFWPPQRAKKPLWHFRWRSRPSPPQPSRGRCGRRTITRSLSETNVAPRVMVSCR